MSASVIAQRTGRQLVVIWRPDHHCEARLSDLLAYSGPVIEDDAADAIRAVCTRVYNYMEIEADAAFQAPILPDPQPVAGDVYVRSAYSLKSPYHDNRAEDRFLRALRPSAAVLDLARSVTHPSDVAVHIRMATGPGFDHLSYESPDNWPSERHDELTEWRGKSDIARFVKRLDALIAAGEVSTIFAATDLDASYAALIDRYGDRIRYLKRAQFDRSSAQIQAGLADMMLLASAPLFLASTWSSFSDIAERLASPMRRVERSGLDF